MADTYVTYTGNGAQTDFNFSFDYLSSVFVKTKLNDSPNTDFILLNEGTIRFDTAPADGVGVRIYRETPRTPQIDFVDGSVLLEGDLDFGYLHTLHVTQEAYDNLGASAVDAITEQLEQAAEYAEDAEASAVLTDADRIATAADRVATGEDRVQTGLDRTAAAASAVAAAASIAPLPSTSGGDNGKVLLVESGVYAKNKIKGVNIDTGDAAAIRTAIGAMEAATIPTELPPTDSSVTWGKLATALLASVANMVAGAANTILTAANFKTYVDTYQPKKVLSFTPAGGSTELVISYQFKAGFNYRIELDDIAVGADSTELLLYMSSDNGATYVNSAGAYTFRNIAGTTGVAGSVTTTTNVGLTVYGLNINDGLTGTLKLKNPAGASKKPRGFFDFFFIESGGGFASGSTQFTRNANMVCDKIKLVTNQNFSARGTVTVYEEPI